MLIKEDRTRTNFIDANDVFVGYDNQQDCCENFGWFFVDEKPHTYIAYDEGFPELAVEGYVFDTSYFETFYSDDTYGVAGMAVFRVVKAGENERYLCLFNDHNGYYSHGFQAKVGGQVWQEGSL